MFAYLWAFFHYASIHQSFPRIEQRNKNAKTRRNNTSIVPQDPSSLDELQPDMDTQSRTSFYQRQPTAQASRPSSSNSLLYRVRNVIQHILGFLVTLTLLRLYLALRVYPNLWRSRRNLQQQQQQQQQRTWRQQQLQIWLDRINRMRHQHGQGPISMASLENIVLRESDFTSREYEDLLRLDEEAGQDVLARRLGLSLDDIRARLSVLTTGCRDPCAICLEDQRPGQSLRQLPCRHCFHTDCIDPWLQDKAVCPVCKTTLL